VRLLGLEAEDTQAIRGDIPTTIARDSLDPRERLSMVNRLYKGKSSEKQTVKEQQPAWNQSPSGCEERQLQVVTPCSSPSSHSDEASVDTCAPRGDVPTTAAQASLDLRVRPLKVDRVTTNPDKTRHLLSESRTVRQIDVRWICQAKRKVAFHDFQRTSLDSHASTCCTSSNMAVLELTGEKVNVFPFSENLPTVQEVPIAMVLTVWKSPRTGELWMLVIHEALYFGERLKESLLCPNQIRAGGNLVQDTPKQFDPQSAHSITIPNIVELPLEMHGIISHLRTRKPMAKEIEQYTNGLFQEAVLTKDIPWEPYSTQFEMAETIARGVRTAVTNMSCFHGSHASTPEEEIQKPPILTQRCIAVASRLFQSQDAVELLYEDNLVARLIAAVNIEADAKSGDSLYERTEDSLCEMSEADQTICTMNSKARGPVITKAVLAKHWGIGLDTVHWTLTVTTQSGIRRVLHPVE
jgi:hypothetical protein